jgi:HAD superfamily hydrolase (TIGR01549 family)
MKTLPDIQVIIWDFDLTLYHKIPELNDDFQKALIKVICTHTDLNEKEARIEFDKIHPSMFASDTKSIAYLSNIPVSQAATELEWYFDRTKYLKYDTKLVDMFKKLSNFRHFILTNGIAAKVREGLNVLGLDFVNFEAIVTSEITGVNKPDPKGLIYIMNITKLPARVHLMVGDRDNVDLVGAQKLGMKTCLVWNESEIADVSIPTIYDFEKIVVI